MDLLISVRIMADKGAVPRTVSRAVKDRNGESPPGQGPYDLDIEVHQALVRPRQPVILYPVRIMARGTGGVHRRSDMAAVSALHVDVLLERVVGEDTGFVVAAVAKREIAGIIDKIIKCRSVLLPQDRRILRSVRTPGPRSAVRDALITVAVRAVYLAARCQGKHEARDVVARSGPRNGMIGGISRLKGQSRIHLLGNAENRRCYGLDTRARVALEADLVFIDRGPDDRIFRGHAAYAVQPAGNEGGDSRFYTVAHVGIVAVDALHMTDDLTGIFLGIMSPR